MSFQSEILQCERCKTEPASFNCPSCSPFHNFCSRCDTIVHSLSIKVSHQRSSLGQPQEKEEPLVEKQQTYQIENDLSHSSIPEDVLPYSREFVNELKNIHSKEKSELQYKIVALQNNLDRLKMTFQNEVQKLQNESNLIAKKYEINQEELISKFKQKLSENENEIKYLQKDNDDLKNENFNLSKKIEEMKEISKENSICYNDQIKALKEEVLQLRNNNNAMHSENLSKVQEIVKTNKNQIEKIKEQHKNELNSLVYNEKYKNEKMKKEIEMNVEEINKLKEENANLQNIIEEQSQKIRYLNKEIINLRGNCEELNCKFENEKHNSNLIGINFDKVKKENLNMKNDFDYLEKTIENLKEEIALLKESNAKKEQDFNSLLNQSEKIRKDFSNKMFDVSYKSYNLLFL